jgi:hypothetical protein
MAKLKEYIMNESVEFSKMENNPMIYTLIVPKVLTGADLDVVKKDEQLKAAIDITEKFIKDNISASAIKELNLAYKPYTVMDVFKYSKNFKDSFSKFFQEFKTIVCNEVKSFTKALELDKKFNELYNSPEYQLYKNTL